jgi:hypothetical protein
LSAIAKFLKWLKTFFRLPNRVENKQWYIKDALFFVVFYGEKNRVAKPEPSNNKLNAN